MNIEIIYWKTFWFRWITVNKFYTISSIPTQVDCYELRISLYVSVYDTEIYDRNTVTCKPSYFSVYGRYDRACLTRVSMAVDRFHVKNHKRAMCKAMMKADDPCHNNICATINTTRRATVFLFLKIWTFIQKTQLSKINYVFHNVFSLKQIVKQSVLVPVIKQFKTFFIQYFLVFSFHCQSFFNSLYFDVYDLISVMKFLFKRFLKMFHNDISGSLKSFWEQQKW